MTDKNLKHLILQDVLAIAKDLRRLPRKDEYKRLGKYWRDIKKLYGSWTVFAYSVGLKREMVELKPIEHKDKILLFDIETAPLLGYFFRLWDENIGLNQIVSDWHMMSFAAKWLDDDTIYYYDNRDAKNIDDDKQIMIKLWELINQADVVVTHNGKKFDVKRMNARFVINDLQPPSSYRHIDTYQIAKNQFGFTSNSLEYLTDKLCKTHKKSKHKEFIGFELWRECLKGNIKAWYEMEKYNKKDVLALEELYKILRPWTRDQANSHISNKCECGGELFENGILTTKTGVFHRHRCKACGAEYKERLNIMPKNQRDDLKIKIK